VGGREWSDPLYSGESTIQEVSSIIGFGTRGKVMLDCRFYFRGREGDKNMGGVSNKCSTYTTDLKLEEGDYRIWLSQIWVRYNVFHVSARGCK
jgi:hypothetical protein